MKREQNVYLNKNEDARTAQLLQLLMLIALNYVWQRFLFVVIFIQKSRYVARASSMI